MKYLSLTSIYRCGCVQVSLNGGRTWHAAVGRETWTYLHSFRGPPASLADTSDCSTFRSDGHSAGETMLLLLSLRLSHVCMYHRQQYHV